MGDRVESKAICQVCGEHKDPCDLVKAGSIRDSVVQVIKKQFPEWSPKGLICLDDLNRFRMAYVEDVLQADRGELSQIEKEVVDSLKEQDLLTQNLNKEFESKLTFGQRLADKIAEFGGSWNFILLFLGILFAWIVANAFVLVRVLHMKAFDEFPFILLNLVLSCLAAIQAPVIMMSQNRQESKDRLRAEHDYKVNLKAEVEIRNLHEKIDHLLQHQWQGLLEIQQTQTDLMEELLERSKSGNSDNA